jgi:hypothetical protein
MAQSNADVFRYLAMQDAVDFALATPRERSPVGSVGDKHPGLYRDSHTVFLNGHVVADVSAWRPGYQKIPCRMRARSRWATAR